MDDPEDIKREVAYGELVDDISQQAIGEFTLERLRSYYLAHDDLASDALRTYREAGALIESSPSAALVLFTTAIEVALKVTLLKPVIYGLVHNESVAELVSDLAVKHNGFDRFRQILARLLAEYGDIDFDTFAIDGHSKTLWAEISILQNARNAVVHRAQPGTRDLAILAQDVAGMVLGNFLPSVLNGLALKIQRGSIGPA